MDSENQNISDKELKKQENLALAGIFERKKKELNLTQSKLAERFNVSQNAISKYLTGRNPLNLNAALQFADALEVSVGDFSPRLEKEIHKISQTNATHITQNNNGNGVQNNHNRIHYSSPCVSNSNLKMPDNSLMPIIPQGSELHIDESDCEIKDGKIYLIEYGGVSWFRRLFKLPNNQVSIKVFENMEFSEYVAALDDVRIIGRITKWVVSD